MKMNILVPNINQCEQKDLFFKFRHKVFAACWGQVKRNSSSRQADHLYVTDKQVDTRKSL